MSRADLDKVIPPVEPTSTVQAWMERVRQYVLPGDPRRLPCPSCGRKCHIRWRARVQRCRKCGAWIRGTSKREWRCMNQSSTDMLPCPSTVYLPGDQAGAESRKKFIRSRWPGAIFRTTTRADGYRFLEAWVPREEAISRREKSRAFNLAHNLPDLGGDKDYETFPAHEAPEHDEELLREFDLPEFAK